MSPKNETLRIFIDKKEQKSEKVKTGDCLLLPPNTQYILTGARLVMVHKTVQIEGDNSSGQEPQVENS